jgi:diguanylate cyclase (GGDEF)-like protein
MSSVKIFQHRLDKKSLLVIRIVTSTVLLLLIAVFEYQWISYSVARTTEQSVLTVKKKEISSTVDNYIRKLDTEKTLYLTDHPGASAAEVKEHVYQTLRRWIYTDQFEDGSYPWVSEILSYEGGENYARRLIHPNLTDTEGMYLSTSMDDGTGYYLYEEELEGIRSQGYIFHEYNFKKLGSDEVTRKLGYTKLYKEYNWVISMGVHLDAFDSYITEAEKNVRPYIFAGNAVLEFLFVISYLILYRFHNDECYHEKEQLEEEVNLDRLTGAGSRRLGETLLMHRLAEFKSSGHNTLVIMGDIDYFKRINDTYGHEVGDIALQKFAGAIQSVIRDQDHIIRWGGDEFVGIFDSRAAAHIDTIGKKLLAAVRSIEIPTERGSVHLTASIGLAVFEASDTCYEDVIRRADQALYRAKEAGRDRYWKQHELPEADNELLISRL